jgi:hypothetical protein
LRDSDHRAQIFCVDRTAFLVSITKRLNVPSNAVITSACRSRFQGVRRRHRSLSTNGKSKHTVDDSNIVADDSRYTYRRKETAMTRWTIMLA